jgi:hypothetical protein
MGWLKLSSPTTQPGSAFKVSEDDWESTKSTTTHIESISDRSEPPLASTYSHAPLSLPDSELPFIPCHEVMKRKSREAGGLCKSKPASLSNVLLSRVEVITIDSIVYDCTEFIDEHPGGAQITESFAGAECSWQFWRFHGKSQMEDFGKPWRVGRTKGMVNKFKEPLKFVGLRRIWDNWD